MLRKVTFCFHSTTLCSYPCPTERLLPSLSHLGTARNPIAAAAPPPTMRRRRGSAAQPESRSFSPLAPPPTKTKDTSTSLSREYCCKALLSSCHSAVLIGINITKWCDQIVDGIRIELPISSVSLSFSDKRWISFLPSFLSRPELRGDAHAVLAASFVRPSERDQAPRSEKGKKLEKRSSKGQNFNSHYDLHRFQLFHLGFTYRRRLCQTCAYG